MSGRHDYNMTTHRPRKWPVPQLLPVLLAAAAILAPQFVGEEVPGVPVFFRQSIVIHQKRKKRDPRP